MNCVTADESLVTKLQEIKEPVQVRDPAGRLLGLYTPIASNREAELYEDADKLFDMEEAKRVAATEQDGAPLHEILERLGTPGPKR